MEGKRRAEVPLTEAQEREAAAMLLPATLPFKLKQAEGRAVRNTKARGADCALHSAPCSPGVLAPVSLQRLKTLIQLEEYGNLPADEPTCAAPWQLCAQGLVD
jgi:hypothetical protein